MATNKELIEKIIKASEIIQQNRLSEVSVNYVIVSPQIAEALDNLDIKKQRRKKLKRIKIKNNLENMNVITLCGSTKYKNDFLMVNKWLTLQGNVVISVAMFGHVDKEPLYSEEKEVLDEIHKRKIDLANEIFVIDINNYIGSSTQSEIEYAKSNGKEVRYLSSETTEFENWKKEFYNRQILEDWNSPIYPLIYQDPNEKTS